MFAEAIVVQGVSAAVASRRSKEAVALIGKDRDKRGKEFIETWKNNLPSLANKVTDTNRGLKAYDRQAAEAIVRTVRSRDFSYQIESLLVIARERLSIAEVPISYVDSVALSTTTDISEGAYDAMIEAIQKMAVDYGEQPIHT